MNHWETIATLAGFAKSTGVACVNNYAAQSLTTGRITLAFYGLKTLDFRQDDDPVPLTEPQVTALPIGLKADHNAATAPT